MAKRAETLVMKKKKRIIYVYPVATAFTERDVQMLKDNFEVIEFEFTQNPITLPFFYILQLFQLLWSLPKTDFYLSFFSGYHTVLPVWLGKTFGIKTIIQCGGTDAVNMPAIAYGNFRKKWLRMATAYSFKNCYKILPVANALVASEYHFDPIHPFKQGLKNLIPDLKTPIEVIQNGFDADFWQKEKQSRTPKSFITVAKGISHAPRAKVKGIDLIEAVAKKFPEASFSLVGDEKYLPKAPNIKVFGTMSPFRLKEMYNSHEFYLQLSSSEGFPNALAEAMLCGCVPIGSAVGDIPEMIDGIGWLLPRKDERQLEELLKKAMEVELEPLADEGRNRILTRFSYQKRKEALLKQFENV